MEKWERKVNTWMASKKCENEVDGHAQEGATGDHEPAHARQPEDDDRPVQGSSSSSSKGGIESVAGGKDLSGLTGIDEEGWQIALRYLMGVDITEVYCRPASTKWPESLISSLDRLLTYQQDGTLTGELTEREHGQRFCRRGQSSL